LPDSGHRLELWRRTIHLFHRAVSADWVGPFLDAGYTDYVVEPTFFDDAGNNGVPDIVASNGDKWLAIDLTENPASKAPKFEKYRRLNARYLHDYGLPAATGEPITLAVRPLESRDGDYAQIVLGDTLKLVNIEAIPDPKLRTSLTKVEGRELRRLPELPFTLVPESKGLEVRKALAPYVMKLFDPSRPVYSAMDFVELGLERLSEHISAQARVSLVDKVKGELETVLISPRNKRVWGLERIAGGYRAAELQSYTAQTLSKVEADIREWCRVKVMLEHFGDAKPAGEGPPPDTLSA
jgi:hypothetical protein